MAHSIPDIKRKLFARKDVLGAFVFGSYARNPGGKHNDVDIFVLTNQPWKRRESKIIDGVNCELFFQNEQITRRIFEEDEELNQLRWFSESTVLFDKTGALKRLIGHAKKRAAHKIHKDNHYKTFLRYQIGDILQDVRKETHPAQKTYLMNLILFKVLFAYFVARKEIPVKKNYQIKKLHAVDPATFEVVNQFLTEPDVDKKESLLNRIIQISLRKIGKPTIFFTSRKFKAKQPMKRNTGGPRRS